MTQVKLQYLSTPTMLPGLLVRCSFTSCSARMSQPCRLTELSTQTFGGKGFEEPTLFQAPDGLLHFIGHNHGRCASGEKYAHFVSQNRSLADWLEAPPFGLASGKPHDSSSLFFVC